MVGPDRLSVPAARAAVDLDPWVGRLVGLDGVEREPVVACSGGPDSVALLALIVASGRTPTAVHVDHGLRPDGSAEGAFVADTAARLGARARAVRVTVVPGPNLEARARVARYRALDEVRVDLRAATVLVGHTADDQAETVLLNLLRGAGPAGLGGIRPGPHHPILALRRAETERVCAIFDLDLVDDPSNLDRRHLRNRVRHELIPLLADLSDRDPVTLLARLADLARSESDLLEELADTLDPTDARALSRAPAPIARRAVRRWLTGDHPPDLATVDRVLAVARGDSLGTEIGGRRRVTRHGQRLQLSDGDRPPLPSQ